MLLIDQEQVSRISKFQLLKLKGSSFRMHLLLPTVLVMVTSGSARLRLIEARTRQGCSTARGESKVWGGTTELAVLP